MKIAVHIVQVCTEEVVLFSQAMNIQFSRAIFAELSPNFGLK